jgi:hypothetical protein
MMSTTVAQLRITRDLHQAEAALDEALVRQANLLATMVKARRETGAGAFVGQEALMRLAKSQQSMLDAGNELCRVHGRLLDVARETNGGADNCPTTATLAAQEMAAGIVHAEAA